MSQAEKSLSTPDCPPSAGKIPEMSRRKFAGLMGLAPIAMLPAAVVAAPIQDADAAFFAAHAEWRAASDDFEATASDEDSEWDRLAQIESDAFDKMVAKPVTTHRALLVKYSAICETERRQSGRFNTSDLILWDMERLAKIEAGWA